MRYLFCIGWTASVISLAAGCGGGETPQTEVQIREPPSSGTESPAVTGLQATSLDLDPQLRREIGLDNDNELSAEDRVAIGLDP